MKNPIFYAKRLPSGFYAIYVNGCDTWLDASRNSISAIRDFCDKVTKTYAPKTSKIYSYTLTFNETEYNALVGR